MNYELHAVFSANHGGTKKTGEQRATKQEVNQWINKMAKNNGGLDYQSGCTVMFNNDLGTIYSWRRMSDGSLL